MGKVDDLLPVPQPHADRQKKADIGFPIRHEIVDQLERIVLQIEDIKADILRRVYALDTICSVDHARVVIHPNAPFNMRSDLVKHAALIAAKVQNGLAVEINWYGCEARRWVALARKLPAVYIYGVIGGRKLLCRVVRVTGFREIQYILNLPEQPLVIVYAIFSFDARKGVLAFVFEFQSSG